MVGRPVCLAVCRVQMVQESHLAQQALPSLRVFPVPRVLVSRAQTVQARYLRELLSRQEARVRVCLVGPAKSAVLPRPQADSQQRRVMRCLLGARRHELAAERSWDFQF